MLLCCLSLFAVWYEPTDIDKASKPWVGGRGHLLSFASPNLNELRSICTYLDLGKLMDSKAVAAVGKNSSEEENKTQQLLKTVLTTAAPLLTSLHALMVTLGPLGFMILRQATSSTLDSPLLPLTQMGTQEETCEEECMCVGLYYPAPRSPDIVSVSGAGDCLAAGFITGMLEGRSVSECASGGQAAAQLSLAASPAVPASLTPAVLPWHHPLPYTLIRKDS
ncbi:hypothetical protein Pcinc_038681 [Petrolisthes cinctipes]|uniref:Carbohydrate kinase PfkB domain-containing protein n=1 Tax=Petrolisthes cinctipes TaxID=88211 RepID=A0AAE1BR24_PETCI|nr:hypothetical protein Pcinc_038681 [Petrolisthes cinctipes]